MMKILRATIVVAMASTLLGGCFLSQQSRMKAAGLDMRSRGELRELATGVFPLEAMTIVDEHGNVEVELDATGAITVKKEAEGKIEGGFYGVPNGGVQYGITREGDFWFANAQNSLKLGTIRDNHLDQLGGERLIVNPDGTIVKEGNSKRIFSTRHFVHPPTQPATAIMLAMLISA